MESYFFLVLSFFALVTVKAQKIEKMKNIIIEPLVKPEKFTAKQWSEITKSINSPSIDYLPKGKISQPDSAGESPISSQIIGGVTASRGLFKWQVGMFIDEAYFCGGCLISENYVLTAGHCVDGFSTFALTIGAFNRRINETGRLVIHSETGILHPDYNDATLANDIALVVSPTPIKKSKFIDVIRLPRISDATKTFEKTKAIASGWGLNVDDGSISNLLKYVNLPVISNSDCIRTFGKKYIISSTLCVSGSGQKGTCQGDSGGPLVYKEFDNKHTLIGTTSFGGNTCVKSLPSAFTRVTSYLGWISELTNITIRE